MEFSDNTTQADVVDHLALVDAAGQDCREKLNSVARILEDVQ